MSDMRRIDNPPQTQPLPDCMMPDGAEPCAGFKHELQRGKRLEDENTRLRHFVGKLAALMETAAHYAPDDHVDQITQATGEGLKITGLATTLRNCAVEARKLSG